MKRIPIFVCPNCGTYKVLLRCWVSANGAEPEDRAGLITYEKGYCTVCEEEVWLREKRISQRRYEEMEDY